jgi:hypothetical protein
VRTSFAALLFITWCIAPAFAGSMMLLGVGGGGQPAPPPTYENWPEAAKELPCDLIVQVGDNVEVKGKIIVDGQSFENHTHRRGTCQNHR